MRQYFIHALAWMGLVCLQAANIFAARGSFKSQNHLQKLTVGPYDNYQGERDSSGNLYFTRKANLVTQLFVQDPKGNEIRILTEVANVKDPRISPNGNKLVFTYYKFDAKGDICILDLPIDSAKEAQCISSRETKNGNPIWLSNTEVLYLSSKIGDAESDLVKQSITGTNREVILRGDISSPSVSHDGRYLLFSKAKGEKSERKIYLAEMNSLKNAKPVGINLPGLSGFIRFSPDDQLVYFSHYLSDTNYDQIIDANDHSVIFRLPFAKMIAAAKSGAELFPEQITSVEANCNFPAPTNGSLLCTCAFGGSFRCL